MSLLVLAVGVVLWTLVGFHSFKFWWTHDHELWRAPFSLVAAASLMGPLAFLIGWCIHGGRK